MADETINFRALLWQNVPIILLAGVLYSLCASYFAAGLNRYPGPLLARFGKLWHFLDLRSSKHPLHLTDLHRRHGDVVRIGPTNLSISSPDYISKIYGVSVNLEKSDMYDSFTPNVNGKPLPFILSAKSSKLHAALLKPVAKDFAVSVISEYEPLVDKTLTAWIKTLDDRFCQQSHAQFDMATWIRCYATEAVMGVTFSEAIGFIDQGGDVQSFFKNLDKNVDAAGLWTTVPWFSNNKIINQVRTKFKKDSSIFPEWAAARMSARIAARAEGKSTGFKDRKGNHLPDFLDRFIDASRIPEPPGYNFDLLMHWCLVNIMAGGDTTSIALNAVVYYVLKHPDKQARLVQELRSSGLTPPMPWKECQKLPYLDACVREGLRMHPPVGTGLERDAGGIVMPDGYVLPEGAKVSMNPWVVARQPSVFGDRVDDFVPERWLRRDDESDQDFSERFSRMKRTDVTFGFGPRVCTGKPVAWMEIYKAAATLFYTFDVELADPNQEWRTVNRWLTRVTDINCRLRKPLERSEQEMLV